MVKFVRCEKDGFVLGFGLSEENIKKLREGQPIRTDLKDLGFSQGTAFIFYGRTEEEMDLELQRNGFITPDTCIKV